MLTPAELTALLHNPSPALIAGVIIALCSLLAVNAIRQAGRVQRVNPPELLRSAELAAWDLRTNSRRLNR